MAEVLSQSTPLPFTSSGFTTTSTPSETMSTLSNYKASMSQNTGPVALLSDKMAHALKNMGYDHYSVQRVRDRVKNNAATAHHSGEDDLWFHTREGSVAAAVKEVLGKILKSDGGLKVNSNEPVVLITVDEIQKRPRWEIENLKRRILEGLSDGYGIRPVRVFIATAVSNEDKDLERQDGFAVTVLNVVNTDVGGPNMIQLLEHEPKPARWQDSVVLTEAWREHDLLWRDERWEKAYNTPGAIDARPLHMVGLEAGSDHNAESRPDATSESTLLKVGSEKGSSSQVLSDSVVELDNPEISLSDDDYVVSEAADQSFTPIQHPALAELSEKDLARAHVQHPTWQHSEASESLFDLVMRQASTLSVSSDEPELIDQPPQSPKVTSNDGFELI